MPVATAWEQRQEAPFCHDGRHLASLTACFAVLAAKTYEFEEQTYTQSFWSGLEEVCNFCPMAAIEGRLSAVGRPVIKQ